jgi:hypothetical protein
MGGIHQSSRELPLIRMASAGPNRLDLEALVRLIWTLWRGFRTALDYVVYTMTQLVGLFCCVVCQDHLAHSISAHALPAGPGEELLGVTGKRLHTALHTEYGWLLTFLLVWILCRLARFSALSRSLLGVPLSRVGC